MSTNQKTFKVIRGETTVAVQADRMWVEDGILKFTIGTDLVASFRVWSGVVSS